VKLSSSPSPAAVRFLIALLCLIWGSTWVVIKGGLRDLPPLTSAGVRFLLAGAIMVGLAALIARREGGGPPPTWLWMIQGTTNFAISYGLVYHAETVLPSGLVSLLWGVYPMLQALAGHWFLEGERLAPRQWLGFAFGLAGLVLLFGTDLGGFGAGGVPTAMLLLLSPVAVVVGTTLVKRHGGRVSSALLNRNAMLLGAALLLGAAWLGERGEPVHWTAPAVASVLYLSLVGTVVTFSLFYWLLRWTPAHRMALIAYVTPALALLLGWAVADEPLSVSVIGGAALILVGVLLVVHRHAVGIPPTPPPRA
jgi:drug/metabolite transporter (DMT)-like permease